MSPAFGDPLTSAVHVARTLEGSSDTSRALDVTELAETREHGQCARNDADGSRGGSTSSPMTIDSM